MFGEGGLGDLFKALGSQDLNGTAHLTSLMKDLADDLSTQNLFDEVPTSLYFLLCSFAYKLHLTYIHSGLRA